MTSILSTTAASTPSLFSGAASANPTASWLADTITAIQNDQNQGGLLGMLQDSGGDGSIDTFLGLSSGIATDLATIAQTSVTNAGSLVAQIAAANQQQAAAKKLQDALDQQQPTVTPTNTLAPFIYLPDGTSIDTTNNIMTMPDGTQYDTTTGAKYVDPKSLIQMANGAYLNTTTNILTMPDGTEINTVTGLTVSVTA